RCDLVGRLVVILSRTIFRQRTERYQMPDAPLDPVRAELDFLRARVSELEAELEARDKRPTPSISPDQPPGARVDQGVSPTPPASPLWLHEALEAAGVLAFVLDVRANQLTASGDLTAFYGAPPGTVLDRLPELLSAIHPDDEEVAATAVQRALAEGGDV